MPYRQYGGSFRGNRGGGRPNKNKLTGLFRTKRPELLTGSIKGEQLENLIDKIKTAKSKGLGIVIFCWKNDRRDNPKSPLFNLSADVEQPMDDGFGDAPPRRQSRSIEPDPTDEPADDGEDPFA